MNLQIGILTSSPHYKSSQWIELLEGIRNSPHRLPVHYDQILQSSLDELNSGKAPFHRSRKLIVQGLLDPRIGNSNLNKLVDHLIWELNTYKGRQVEAPEGPHFFDMQKSIEEISMHPQFNIKTLESLTNALNLSSHHFPADLLTGRIFSNHWFPLMLQNSKSETLRPVVQIISERIIDYFVSRDLWLAGQEHHIVALSRMKKTLGSAFPTHFLNFLNRSVVEHNVASDKVALVMESPIIELPYSHRVKLDSLLIDRHETSDTALSHLIRQKTARNDWINWDDLLRLSQKAFTHPNCSFFCWSAIGNLAQKAPSPEAFSNILRSAMKKVLASTVHEPSREKFFNHAVRTLFQALSTADLRSEEARELLSRVFSHRNSNDHTRTALLEFYNATSNNLNGNQNGADPELYLSWFLKGASWSKLKESYAKSPEETLKRILSSDAPLIGEGFQWELNVKPQSTVQILLNLQSDHFEQLDIDLLSLIILKHPLSMESVLANFIHRLLDDEIELKMSPNLFLQAIFKKTRPQYIRSKEDPQKRVFHSWIENVYRNVHCGADCGGAILRYFWERADDNNCALFSEYFDSYRDSDSFSGAGSVGTIIDSLMQGEIKNFDRFCPTADLVVTNFFWKYLNGNGWVRRDSHSKKAEQNLIGDNLAKAVRLLSQLPDEAFSMSADQSLSNLFLQLNVGRDAVQREKMIEELTRARQYPKRLEQITRSLFSDRNTTWSQIRGLLEIYAEHGISFDDTHFFIEKLKTFEAWKEPQILALIGKVFAGSKASDRSVLELAFSPEAQEVYSNQIFEGFHKDFLAMRMRQITAFESLKAMVLHLESEKVLPFLKNLFWQIEDPYVRRLFYALLVDKLSGEQKWQFINLVLWREDKFSRIEKNSNMKASDWIDRYQWSFAPDERCFARISAIQTPDRLLPEKVANDIVDFCLQEDWSSTAGRASSIFRSSPLAIDIAFDLCTFSDPGRQFSEEENILIDQSFFDNPENLNGLSEAAILLIEESTDEFSFCRGC